jgi:CHAT domain-containing protein
VINRHARLDELRLLELEQEDVAANPVKALPARAVPFASLEQVQRTLASHEAMIWFSIAPSIDIYDDFGGGSWAVVITRDGAAVRRLGVSDALDPQVAALVGLLRDRPSDPSTWAPAARRLGQALLADTLAGLPSSITALVLVTDGPLHRMPFEVLLAGSRSVGERFDISVAPSATVWVRTRDHRTAAPPGALVLADPDVTPAGNDRPLTLAPLPAARREAAGIARILHLDATAVREGPLASETFVKSGALAHVGILHLAAHARADTAFPARSAVFLAAGDGDEDGWLQPREIARLELGGRLVVLSACESAAGSLLPGEGPLSLARAFFAAGARAIVATRWPLRDDDAAFMMQAFYEALRDGEPAAAALRRARAAAISAKLPVAAWGGVVVIGDGLQTIAVAQPSRTPRPWLALGYGLLLAAAAVVWRVTRQRARRETTARL